MQILFTYKPNNLFSKLIRDITKEPVSHTAIRVGEFVIHSNFRGVNIEPYTRFSASNKIAYSVDMVADPNKIRNTLDKYWKKWYDVPALFYIGLRYLFPKLMPKANLWNSSDMFICTEFVTQVVDAKADSLITPYQLYLRLENKPANLGEK